jgi:diacylglycerol kinase (ATP)
MFFSVAGLRAALRYESAFRQECALAIIMIPAAFWVGTSVPEYLLLIGSILIVLITELLNSAIEAVVDRVGTEIHPLSGRAKDMGSAAVFVALLLAAIVWGVLIWTHYAH